MKKIYKKPTLIIETFVFDSIMTGTGESIESNISPLITEISGGSINLGDHNTLQSINYKDFTLKLN